MTNLDKINAQLRALEDHKRQLERERELAVKLSGGVVYRPSKNDKVIININGEKPTAGIVVRLNGIVFQCETDVPGELANHRNKAGELWLNDFELSPAK